MTTSIVHPIISTLNNDIVRNNKVDLGADCVLSLQSPYIDISSDKWYDPTPSNNTADIIGATKGHPGEYATGTFENSGFVLPGEYLTIDIERFTAVSGTPGIFEFDVGSNMDEMAINLRDCINTYSTLVDASIGTPTSDVVITSKNVGSDYNYFYNSTSGSINGGAGAYMTGGANPHLKGLSFDGIDDYINCGNDASLNITNQITFGAWIKQTPGTNGYTLLKATATDSKRLYGLYFDGGLNRVLSFYYDGIRKSITWSYNCADNIWHNYVVTYSGLAANLYIDGVVQTPQILDGAFQGDLTADVIIGKRFPNDYHFNGSIDDIRIYNRALSGNEIAYYYNTTKDQYL